MPLNFTPEERQALLNELGLGRDQAIGAKKIAQILGYSIGGNQVQLRSLIKKCIENDGDLIGAVTGRPAGFFIINSLQELEKYVDSLESRTRSANVRRSALLSSWINANSPATNRNTLTIT